jgi:4-aminobutyrate aminotransferase
MITNHIVYNVVSDFRFKITGADGPYIYDEKKRKIIDFTSGWNVANLGWNHPEIIEAVQQQAGKNMYAPMWSADPIQEEYAAALTSELPKELNAVCRATGGTEANEVAIKIARAATGRKKIIGFQDTFHGQTFGALGLGYRREWVEAISPLVPDFMQIEYPAVYAYGDRKAISLDAFLENLEELLKQKDVAAIVAESGIVTGWGKTLIAPKGFIQSVRNLTKKYGTYLILDEVGTGFSRCGKLFGHQLDGVVPDVITFAKGISNGAAAISVCVVNSQVVEPVIGAVKLVSTFGWTPIACAAAHKTLAIHKRDKVWEKSQEDGIFILGELQRHLENHPSVGNIRGIGMELAITFVKDGNPQSVDEALAIRIRDKAFEKGLHLVHGGDGNIQIMPPLTTPRSVLQEGLDIFVDTVKQLTV